MPIYLVVAGILLFAAACSPNPPPCSDGTCVPAPEATNAMLSAAASVVHAFYGTKAPLPQIVAYDKGDCDSYTPSPTGATLVVPGGKIMVQNYCAFGTWHAPDNTIYMTLTDWKETICHELLHQYLMDTYVDGDVKHTRPEWKTMVPAAMSLL